MKTLFFISLTFLRHLRGKNVTLRTEAIGMHLLTNTPVICCCTGALVLLFSACTVTETVYLQDLNVSGPVTQPPIHITDGTPKLGVTFSPYYAYNNQELIEGRIEGHSQVSAAGTFVVDTIRQNGEIVGFEEPLGVNAFPYQGNNIHWTMPTSVIGVDLNYNASPSLAVSLGVSYSSVKSRGLWGGNAGLGYLFAGSGVAGRLEGGVQWQTMAYVSSSVVVTTITPWFSNTTTKSVAFYEDEGTTTPINFYGSFTLNTTMDMPVNFFAQIAVLKQRVTDFRPTHLSYVGPYFQFVSQEARVQNSTMFFTVSPGVYIPLSEASRLLVGGRIIFPTDIENSSSPVIFMPTARIDWNL